MSSYIGAQPMMDNLDGGRYWFIDSNYRLEEIKIKERNISIVIAHPLMGNLDGGRYLCIDSNYPLEEIKIKE